MEAAEWLARIDDSLSGEEQDAYIEWLSKDEKHRRAISLLQWSWGELDRLAGLQTSHQAPVNPALLMPEYSPSQKSRWFFRNMRWNTVLGLAALVVVSFTGVVVFNDNSVDEQQIQPAYELMERLVHQDLEDGSHIELNRGTRIKTKFSKEKRLVLLEGGEANFIVAKDPNRPFVVSVGGIEVKAVGTVFNIKYVGKKVDVIVSEGKVQVGHEPGFYIEKEISVSTPLLTAGQKVTVQIESDLPMPIVTVETLDKEDLQDALKWQPRLLKFNSAPLSDIIQGFNRHNQIQVELANPELEQMTLSSIFWSDNVEGFVRLMENNFGMQVVWVDRHRIRLMPENERIHAF
jgi:transmembrane sensor